MAYGIAKVLQPAIINGRINRLKLVNTVLQNHMGIQKDGPNVRKTPSRRGSIDIFNKTRNLSNPSVPGSPARLIAPNPVGNYPFIIPRVNDSMSLPGELLSQIRPIGGPASDVDSSAMQYIADQERFLKDMVTTVREFQAAAVLRGSYSYSNVTGSEFGNLSHAFTGGSVTVDYQVPSGNKSQLNMLGAGSIIGTTWANAAAPILSNLESINAALIQLTGLGLADVWCTSSLWGYIRSNTQVNAAAGTANTYFQEIDRDKDTQNFRLVLRGIPWVTFHITDNGVNINGSFTKLVDDTCAAFTVPMDSTIVKLYTCREPVSEWQGMPAVDRYEEYYWITPTFNPTGYQLFDLYNGIPVVEIPKGIAYGTVVF